MSYSFSENGYVCTEISVVLIRKYSWVCKPFRYTTKHIVCVMGSTERDKMLAISGLLSAANSKFTVTNNIHMGVIGCSHEIML